MPHTNPAESKRGARVPSSSARAASTTAPLLEDSAGTHTALTGEPSPKSTTTATVTPAKVGEYAHGDAVAGGAGANTITPAATHTATTNARRFTCDAGAARHLVARAALRGGRARPRPRPQGPTTH